MEVPRTIDSDRLGLPLWIGVIGIIAEEARAETPSEQLGHLIAANDIDLGRIAYEAFRAQLADTHAFAIVAPAADVPNLRLSIFDAGLGRPVGGWDQLKPTVSLLGSLTRADGTVLWRKADYVSTSNSQTPAFTYDQYVNDPENLRLAFRRATDLVTGMLVADLCRP